MRLGDLERQLPDGGEVLRREAFSGAAGGLLEGHVQMPVKLVLYAPSAISRALRSTRRADGPHR